MPHKYQFVSKYMYPADYHCLCFNDIGPLIWPEKVTSFQISHAPCSRGLVNLSWWWTWNSKKFLLKNWKVSIHIKKMKKNLNDRMLDKSGEFFLKPFVSTMHIVFDFRRVQLVDSLKVYSSYWWVLLGSWSVPGGFQSVPGGFWLVKMPKEIGRSEWLKYKL